jgi:hypothetical protein
MKRRKEKDGKVGGAEIHLRKIVELYVMYLMQIVNRYTNALVTEMTFKWI